MNKIAILVIKFYQRVISPAFPPSCRFYPTCSHYAVESFQVHGFFKAFWLSLKRISKCHPFHKGGFDPVPGKGSENSHVCCSKK